MNGFNFTEDVRRVLQGARNEAQGLDHEYVGTEHVLLALARDEHNVAAEVLRSLAIEPVDLRAKLEDTVKRGNQSQAERSDFPYTSRAKKVLELAMSEARDMGHSYVGSEHLLLGLLREEKGIAAQVLTYHGATMDALRAHVLQHPTVAERATQWRAPARRDSSPIPRTTRGQWAFVLLWYTLGIVVLVESLQPLTAFYSGSLLVSRGVASLAAAEVIGALLFLVPRTVRYGAWILLGVFAVAIVAHVGRGQFPAPLFVYAAGAYYVLTRWTRGTHTNWSMSVGARRDP